MGITGDVKEHGKHKNSLSANEMLQIHCKGGELSK